MYIIMYGFACYYFWFIFVSIATFWSRKDPINKKYVDSAFIESVIGPMYQSLNYRSSPWVCESVIESVIMSLSLRLVIGSKNFNTAFLREKNQSAPFLSILQLCRVYVIVHVKCFAMGNVFVMGIIRRFT